MRAHHFIRQFPDLAGSDTAALVENAELARHAACERQLLLDQQHGKSFFRIQLQDDVANFADDIGLNPFGRLVKNQQFRFEHEGAADRELVLLAPPKGRRHAG